MGPSWPIGAGGVRPAGVGPGSRVFRLRNGRAVEHAFNVTPDSFQPDVVERSATVPVVLLFWAAQSAPAADAKRQLEALVGQYGGKVLLGLVDVAADPTLAQHLRVQALPSLRVIDKGQIVHQLEGPQPEPALRSLFDQLTMSAADVIKGQLGQYLEQKDFRSALGFLQQAIAEEPNNASFRIELADVLVRQGDLDEARKALQTVPAEAPERDRPETRLALADEAASLPSSQQLLSKLADQPDDVEALHQLAVVEAAAENFEAALESALKVLQTDRAYGDDIGRLTMIRIFTVLGKGNELANAYRRRMFNFMH
ncbi:MAG: tetratricopeptide repeat protein [Gammaproteobacteria bacterium]|nr:tetratricopeptide repeat protein [Gammaproteobacteria bacterium]